MLSCVRRSLGNRNSFLRRFRVDPLAPMVDAVCSKMRAHTSTQGTVQDIPFQRGGKGLLAIPVIHIGISFFCEFRSMPHALNFR